MRLCAWVDVIGGRERPPFRGKQETVIAEVVVGVAEHNVEGHSAIEFPEILPNVGTAPEDEFRRTA